MTYSIQRGRRTKVVAFVLLFAFMSNLAYSDGIVPPNTLPFVANNTLLGNNTGATIYASGLTQAQVQTMLQAFLLPHVADNAALAASTQASLSGVLVRDTYSSGVGSPSTWKFQTGTCASHSLTSDGGSCQDNADGNSYLRIS